MTKKGMSPERAEQIRIRSGIGEGTKLRRVRVKKGISQTELAAIAGVSLKTLQRFEQGKTYVDGAKFDTLCNLCVALDCRIEDIIESEELRLKYFGV